MNDVVETAFGKMPRHLVDHGVATNAAMKRANHARRQIELWTAEHKRLSEHFESMQKENANLISRWNPTTGELEMPQEAK